MRLVLASVAAVAGIVRVRVRVLVLVLVLALALALASVVSPAYSADFEMMELSTESARSLVFSRDGNGVYIGDSDGNIRLWDLTTGEVSVRVAASPSKESGTVYTNLVRVTPDGAHALNAYDTGEIRYVDLSTGKEVWQVRFLYGRLLSLAISPDGKHGLASDDSTRVVLFDISDSNIVWDFEHNTPVYDAVFSASGDLIFEAELNRFRAEDLEAYLAPFDFDVPNSGYAGFGDIDVAKTGVVAAADLGEVHLYDGKTGKRLRIVEIEGELSANIVAISEDGRRFLTEVANRQAGLFDAKSGKLLGAVGVKQDFGRVEALAFSPDGHRFVIADDDGRISLWLTKGLRKIATARLWRGGSVVFLPDGSFMIETGPMADILSLKGYDVSEARPAKVKAAFTN